MLNGSIRNAINFSTTVKTGLAHSSELLKLTMVLYMPRARQQSFYSTDFRALGFSTMDYGMTLRQKLLGFHLCHLRGKTFFTRRAAGIKTHRVYIKSFYCGSHAVERS